MGIDHNGFNTAVAEKLLDGVDIIAGFKQVCCKWAAESAQPIVKIPDRKTVPCKGIEYTRMGIRSDTNVAWQNNPVKYEHIH